MTDTESLSQTLPDSPLASGQPGTASRSESVNEPVEGYIGAKHFEITDIAGGCIMVFASGAISCVLLVINGAFVMALLSAFAAGGARWVENEKFSQFLLFSLPVALLIVQWYLIDTLRWILRRRVQK
ncbi:hypothetical protein [Neorhodopirellula lusitana]|uniref:hypothetical protein n=1 Tax=Neorhodopirellula lusitana TaxID=445327 RepID=UPI00384F016C